MRQDAVLMLLRFEALGTRKGMDRTPAFAAVYSTDIRRVETEEVKCLKRLVRPRGIEPLFPP